MSEIILQVQPVGVKVLSESTNVFKDTEVYRGTSYCDAVRRATMKEELLVLSGSVLTCQWSPVVLGLKEPENSFERRLSPRLDKTRGIYLAPLSSQSWKDTSPDIVIIRDKPDLLKDVISITGWNRCSDKYSGEMDKSALGILRNNTFSLKSASTVVFNRLLAMLSKSKGWHRLTEKIFSSTFACDMFDRLISLFTADMSICRNSTVIPYKTGLVNVSHFCSGGISWGLNLPDNLTSGFPYGIFENLAGLTSVRWHENNEEITPVFLPGKNCGCSLKDKTCS